MAADDSEALASAVGALTPRMRRNLVVAHGIASGLEMTWVGTEHVLLALIADEGGLAGQVMAATANPEVIEADLRRIMSSAGYWTESRDIDDPPAR